MSWTKDAASASFDTRGKAAAWGGSRFLFDIGLMESWFFHQTCDSSFRRVTTA